VKSRPIRDWTSRRFKVLWVFSKNPKLVKVINQVETEIIPPLPGVMESSGTSVIMHWMPEGFQVEGTRVEPST